MAVIGSVGVGPVQLGGARQARGPSGFRLPATRTAATGPAAAAEEVGLAGMLALQELPDRDVADREARQRGKELLAALAEIQRAMLGREGGDAARLEQLAASVPTAADPGLRAVVAAIALHARVEAARISMLTEGNSRNSTESS